MSWGMFLGGYFPNQTFIKSLKNNFFLAVQGSLDDDSQTSRQLLHVFLFGHTCDLVYISAQKALRALCKWHTKHSDVQISANSSFIKLLTRARAMNMLNCENISVGAFQFGDTRWSFQTPVEWCERLSHHFRTWWRTQTMQRWLGSQRNDAQLARTSGLTLSQKFGEQLHLETRDLDGHQCSIASGGFVSAAKWETIKNFVDFARIPFVLPRNMSCGSVPGLTPCVGTLNPNAALPRALDGGHVAFVCQLSNKWDSFEPVL